MASSRHAHVIAVLEQAGYRNSEDSLPVHSSGGTFSTAGGSPGVNVTWRRWDASQDQLGELRVGIAAALRAAGLEVHERGARIFVPGSGREVPSQRTGYPAMAGPSECSWRGLFSDT
jgi:hypothetical protein